MSRKTGLFQCSFLLVLIFVVTSLADTDKIRRVKPYNNRGKQFPGVNFVLPATNLFNIGNGGNLFGSGKSVVTRTLISTVSTVTVPSYRTCTMTNAAFPACAGRRRRDTDNELQDDQPIEHTPAIKIIVGKTEISDPEAVAQILHLKSPYGHYGQEEREQTTTTVPLLARNEDLSTLLYPSEDATEISPVKDDEPSSDSPVTTETPSFDDVVEDTTTSEPVQGEEDNDEKARLGFGNNAAKTTTSTIPVTHVVSTAVTVAMSTLTVMYQGCSPPGPLPVIAPAC